MTNLQLTSHRTTSAQQHWDRIVPYGRIVTIDYCDSPVAEPVISCKRLYRVKMWWTIPGNDSGDCNSFIACRSVCPCSTRHFICRYSCFHSRLKTYLFHKSYPLSSTSSCQTAFAGFCLHRFFWWLIGFYSFSLFVVSVPCARLRSAIERTQNISYRIVCEFKA